MRRFLTLIIAIAVIPAVAKSDQLSAEQIIDKCYNHYDGAKTYQATITTTLTNPSNSISMIWKMQAENDGTGQILRSVGAITSKSTQNGIVQTDVHRFVDDGTTIYDVYPNKKSYSSRPHAPDTLSALFRSTIERMRKACWQLTVTTTKINGRDTYKLIGKSKDSSNYLLIDKETFAFNALHGIRNAGPNQAVADFITSGQIFNRPIKPDAFQWTLPSGYTKLEPAEPQKGPPS